MIMASEPDLRSLGPRLRAARKEQGITLQQLAERAGMSASTLSRLESGKRQPNLALLLPLTRELRIGLDDLIPRPVPDPRIEQQPIREGGHTVVPLSPPAAPLQTYKISYPARVRRPEQRTHDGYEWLYVLSGKLRLVLGEHDLVLGAGEAAEFDTRVPHGMCGIGQEPAEALSIFSADGVRIHLRARSRPKS
jgi:transcriptional regulator with XRE-family HTH domain